jgi:hypothetical protein
MQRSDSKRLGYKQIKSISTLSYKCKGLEGLICSICKSHQLNVPDFISHRGGIPSTDETIRTSNPSRKRTLPGVHEANKRHHNGSNIQANDSEHIDASDLSGEDDKFDSRSEIASDDESSFGALGDWG